MKCIRSRLDDGIHDGAIAAAEFCAVGVGLHFEFADRIHRRLNYVGAAVEYVAEVRVVVDAVEQIVVLEGARSVGTEPEARFRS